MMHFKVLEKQEQVNPKISRKKENWSEINEMETKKRMQRINETKNWFLKGLTSLTDLYSK
jgi:hypothetical protein